MRSIFKTSLKRTAGALLLSAFIFESASAEPSWFQGKASECDQYIDKDLQLTDAPPISLFGIVDIPQQLDKRDHPGFGKCCIFDKQGNLIEANYQTKGGKRVRVSGSGFVTRGNDECGEWVRAEKKKNRNVSIAGLWWCVGPQSNCHMDWWLIEP